LLDRIERRWINAHTRDAGSIPRSYSELCRNIPDKFNEAGVEVVSRHVSAPRDDNSAALPEDDLPKKHNAPAFRFTALEWMTKK
jgi:hypothetical protein